MLDGFFHKKFIQPIAKLSIHQKLQRGLHIAFSLRQHIFRYPFDNIGEIFFHPLVGLIETIIFYSTINGKQSSDLSSCKPILLFYLQMLFIDKVSLVLFVLRSYLL